MAKGFGKLQSSVLLDSVFKTLANIYVALHVADPGVDGQSGAEGLGSGYARVNTVPADWDAATDAMPSVTQNANAITFPTASGNWNAGADFTHFSLWKTLTGATEADYLGRGELTVPKPVLNGDTADFAAGNLQFLLNETV